MTRHPAVLAVVGEPRRLSLRRSRDHLKLSAGDQAVRLEIALAGGVHDAVRQGWRRRLAVPAAGAALCVEIIAQRLLVETRLRPARRIDVRSPEPRAVRRHHLVDQDDADRKSTRLNSSHGYISYA